LKASFTSFAGYAAEAACNGSQGLAAHEQLRAVATGRRSRIPLTGIGDMPIECLAGDGRELPKEGIVPRGQSEGRRHPLRGLQALGIAAEDYGLAGFRRRHASARQDPNLVALAPKLTKPGRAQLFRPAESQGITLQFQVMIENQRFSISIYGRNRQQASANPLGNVSPLHAKPSRDLIGI
jgi:hypothetical protein